jgi:hypothetical protein
MGGQACVLYGAAEFSRDLDIAIGATSDDLRLLRSALVELGASVIAVPAFEAEYLDRGHAVHFRCEATGCLKPEEISITLCRHNGFPGNGK